MDKLKAAAPRTQQLDFDTATGRVEIDDRGGYVSVYVSLDEDTFGSRSTSTRRTRLNSARRFTRRA